MKKITRHHIKGFAMLVAFAVGATICIPFIIILISQFLNHEQSFDYISSAYRLQVPDTINVYRHDVGIVENIPFEEYVMGVVAGEMPASFEEEALKAQAVAARTYSLSKVIRSGENGFPEEHPAAPLCDDIHCQVYRSLPELEALKSPQWIRDSWPKIQAAVTLTSGELMYYGNDLVHQALFHSSSGGTTENSEDVFVSAVPYLRSVSSPYEQDATHQNEQTIMSLRDIASRLNTAFPNIDFGYLSPDNIGIISNTPGGRVEAIQFGDGTLSGSQVRTLLGLSSANFTIEISPSASDYMICFTTNGYGHGVGMSQYGANGMAKAGYNYKDILKHYYSGISVY